MAAQGYYNGAYNSPPAYDHQQPDHATDPFNRVSPRPAPSPYQHNNDPYYQSPISDPHDPHNLRYSQQSIGSDNGAYVAGGRMNDHDQYAENIPLKSPTGYNNEPPPQPWMQQPTHYAPDPNMMEPQAPRGRPQRKGFFKKKIAYVTYILTAAQIVVFIVELIKAGQLTGSPVQTKPQFNPMIGPSAYVQINMGARYTPCMKNVPGVQNATLQVNFPCPNSTTTDSDCTLSELCGFDGVPNPEPNGSLDDKPEPNQWFRFIIPMFLHSGFIHIGFNLIVQLTMGADMERTIGWWRYAIVYLSSGIWGFVLGGNYAGQGEASCGASGALFGILALFVLDLLYTWPERQNPWVELIIMILGIAISFVLGLLPGLDNFSHLGGFTMGLALGLTIMRSPNALRERIGLARSPYVAMSGGVASENAQPDPNKVPSGSKLGKYSPKGFFAGRKPLWWAWWLVRLGALVGVIVGFILLIVNFYKYPSSNCSWCYRLSCLHIAASLSLVYRSCNGHTGHVNSLFTILAEAPPKGLGVALRTILLRGSDILPFNICVRINDVGCIPSSILGVFLYFCLNISYTTAVFTDPGSPLSGSSGSRRHEYSALPITELPEYTSYTVNSEGQTRFCKKCQCPKPDRAHHCSTCKRCVLKMDHHCPWLATCVGLHNYKAFLLFLVYTSLFCWVDFFVSAMWIWTEIFSEENYMDGILPVNVVLLSILGGIIGLVLTGFTAWHISLALRGLTTIECLEKTRYVSPLRKALDRRRYQGILGGENAQNGEQDSFGGRLQNYGNQILDAHANAIPGVTRPEEGEDQIPGSENMTPAQQALSHSYADLERQREYDRYQDYLAELDNEKMPNAFDLGWKRNLLHLFGDRPLFWLVPVRTTTGNGWDWEPSRKFLEAQERARVRREQAIAEQQEFDRNLYLNNMNNSRHWLGTDVPQGWTPDQPLTGGLNDPERPATGVSMKTLAPMSPRPRPGESDYGDDFDENRDFSLTQSKGSRIPGSEDNWRDWDE
ncbi:DHHC palmitoyltransferase-domain-containing protein [Aspergillus karnatakaensis]|uniref:rhomboid family membrane protein n=1 Tax=Aspergillus karnatakaensis TaxID=1810916 RepID=UPI003CCE0456